MSVECKSKIDLPIHSYILHHFLLIFVNITLKAVDRKACRNIMFLTLSYKTGDSERFFENV